MRTTVPNTGRRDPHRPRHPHTFCKRTHTGSMLARVSAIPTVALVAPIPFCGSVRKANTSAGAGLTHSAILPHLDCAHGLSWLH